MYLQTEIDVLESRNILLQVAKTRISHIFGANRTIVSRELIETEHIGFNKMRNRTIIVNEIS